MKLPPNTTTAVSANDDVVERKGHMLREKIFRCQLVLGVKTTINNSITSKRFLLFMNNNAINILNVINTS